MKVNYHHITIKGKPLCECESHAAGLLGHRSPPVTYNHLGEDIRLACSFRSKARARSAWKEIAKVRYWKEVKVIPGQCPASGP